MYLAADALFAGQDLLHFDTFKDRFRSSFCQAGGGHGGRQTKADCGWSALGSIGAARGGISLSKGYVSIIMLMLLFRSAIFGAKMQFHEIQELRTYVQIGNLS